MKKIVIDRICLRYFKGIEDKEIVLEDHINVIKGRNGIGKSTIADAVSWVLFGTNQAGDTKFGIKTKGKDGKEIEDVAHSVEISLSVYDEQEGLMCYVLTRTLTESRKDDGSVTNTYTYKVDGEVETAGDFKKAVDEICPEKVFRLCSSPSVFAQMEWGEQRKMLTEMFGEPSMEDVTGGDKRFDAVKEILEQKDLDKALKHLRYKRKEVQSEMDEAPVRLDALKNVLPKTEDWDALAHDIELLDGTLKESQSKLNTIERGEGGRVKKAEISKSLDFLNKRKRIMENEAHRKMSEMMDEYAGKKRMLQENAASAESTVVDLKRKAASYDELMARCDEHLKELDVRKVEGAALWKTISARTWEWDDNASYCPTCGQMLPGDRIAEMKEDSLKRFNTANAEELKKLRERAASINDETKQCNENIEHYKAEQKTTLTQLEKAETVLKEAREAMEELNEGRVDETVDSLLAKKPEYKDVCEQIAGKEAELEAPVEDSESEKLKAEIQKEIDEAKAAKEALQARLAVKAQWVKVSEQIEAVKSDRKTWQAQLDEFDDKIKALSDYQKKACEALENIVNRRFNMVKWSMFRRQLDGTDKPWCECSVDGVPYADLNSAAKINAGLDIARALKEYYQVDVPCVIDNAETVLEPLYDGGQQIRLTVTEDKELTIECHGDKD